MEIDVEFQLKVAIGGAQKALELAAFLSVVVFALGVLPSLMTLGFLGPAGALSLILPAIQGAIAATWYALWRRSLSAPQTTLPWAVAAAGLYLLIALAGRGYVGVVLYAFILYRVARGLVAVRRLLREPGGAEAYASLFD